MTQPVSTLLIQLQTPGGEWIDVGYLHNANEHNWFEFVPTYWGMADRPVLGQIFEENGRSWTAKTNIALPRWFSHLLPEGRVRDAVADAAQVNRNREFQLLERLGKTDLPGAIRAIAPADAPSTAIPSIPDENDLGEDDPLLKFSLAGAQLKFSVYGDERGLTVPASGRAGNVILKFPDDRSGFGGVPEVELASLELARSAGIPTPQATLVDPRQVKGLERWAARTTGKALAVRRFDRRDGEDLRTHMEELAQILGTPTARDGAKYKGANFETVAIFVGALTGIQFVGEVIDRIVLNVLVGNGDAHVKNWAFVYPDGKHPELSPAYDILPTVLYIQNDDLGLKLSGSKAFEAVTPTSFESMGARSGFGADEARRRATEATERVLDSWQILRQTMPSSAYERLTARLKELRLPRTK